MVSLSVRLDEIVVYVLPLVVFVGAVDEVDCFRGKRILSTSGRGSTFLGECCCFWVGIADHKVP